MNQQQILADNEQFEHEYYAQDQMYGYDENQFIQDSSALMHINQSANQNGSKVQNNSNNQNIHRGYNQQQSDKKQIKKQKQASQPEVPNGKQLGPNPYQSGADIQAQARLLLQKQQKQTEAYAKKLTSKKAQQEMAHNIVEKQQMQPEKFESQYDLIQQSLHNNMIAMKQKQLMQETLNEIENNKKKKNPSLYKQAKSTPAKDGFCEVDNKLKIYQDVMTNLDSTTNQQLKQLINQYSNKEQQANSENEDNGATQGGIDSQRGGRPLTSSQQQTRASKSKTSQRPPLLTRIGPVFKANVKKENKDLMDLGMLEDENEQPIEEKKNDSKKPKTTAEIYDNKKPSQKPKANLNMYKQAQNNKQNPRSKSQSNQQSVGKLEQPVIPSKQKFINIEKQNKHKSNEKAQVQQQVMPPAENAAPNDKGKQADVEHTEVFFVSDESSIEVLEQDNQSQNCQQEEELYASQVSDLQKQMNEELENIQSFFTMTQNQSMASPLKEQEQVQKEDLEKKEMEKQANQELKDEAGEVKNETELTEEQRPGARFQSVFDSANKVHRPKTASRSPAKPLQAFKKPGEHENGKSPSDMMINNTTSIKRNNRIMKFDLMNKSDNKRENSTTLGRDRTRSPCSKLLIKKQISMQNEHASPVRKVNASQQQQPQPPKNSIVCSIVSVEPFIRRAIKKMGWQDNINSDTTKFHVKFDVSDIDIKVNQNQLYNHFPDNREITTKAGLCKNLWNLCSWESQLQVSHMFPRCYDLSDVKQTTAFRDDFNQTAILSLVKIAASRFIQEANIQHLCNEYDRKKQFNCSKVYKRQFRERCSLIDKESGDMGKNENLNSAFHFAKHYLRQINIDQVKRKSYLNFGDEYIQKLVAYFYEVSANKQKLFKNNIPIFEKIQICRLHSKLCKNFPQYAKIDGMKNVWVVKPSYNARGIGIYCTDKFRDVVHEGKKATSKIVQKYIENPLLIKGKKFDIRQWVLVTSWEPLDVYVFDNAYIRLCSTDYTLSDLSDVYKHLSNYSIQKHNDQAQGQTDSNPLVLSSKEFQSQMNISWDEEILPRIKDVVYKSLKALTDSQYSDNKANCFEIYGFDFLLDEKYNLWVIEVNLSPACTERATWLTKMLDDMAFGLTDWLERRILMNAQVHIENFNDELMRKRKKYLGMKNKLESLKTLNIEEFYEHNNIQYKWLRLEESIKECLEYNADQRDLTNLNQVKLDKLELIGAKADIKYEKRLDLNHKKRVNTLFIQSCWRGYKARCLALFLRRTNAAVYIQKCMRRCIAKNVAHKLRVIRSCKLIQRSMYRIVAKRNLEERRATRIFMARLFVAKKLQGHYKRKRATRLVQQMRYNHNAMILQKYMQGRLAFLETRRKRYVRVMTVRLQRFFKRRYKYKNKNSIIVQKFLKGLKQWKRWQRLRIIAIGAVKVQKHLVYYDMVQGYYKFRVHRDSIRIQCQIRQYLAKKLLRKLQVEKAQKVLGEMFESYVRKIEMISTIKDLKNELNAEAQTVQHYLRKYIKLQRIRKLQYLYLREISAICIQKNVRCFLRVRQYQRMLQVIEDSATKIQSICKMFVERKRYKKQLEMIRKNRFDLKKFEILKQLNKKKTFQQQQREAQQLENEIQEYIERKPIKNIKKEDRLFSEPDKNRSGKKNKSRGLSQSKFAYQQPGAAQPKKQKRLKDGMPAMSKAAQKIRQLEDEFFGRIQPVQSFDIQEERIDIDPGNLHLPQVQNFQPKKKKQQKQKKRNEIIPLGSQQKMYQGYVAMSQQNTNLQVQEFQDNNHKLPNAVQAKASQKSSFAENLKNILSKQIIEDDDQESDNQQSRFTRQLQKQKDRMNRAADFLDDIRISQSSLAKKQESTQNMPQNLAPVQQRQSSSTIFTKNHYSVDISQKSQSRTGYDDGSDTVNREECSNQGETIPSLKQNPSQKGMHLENRPIRDPRMVALQNIEHRSQFESQIDSVHHRHEMLDPGIGEHMVMNTSPGQRIACETGNLHPKSQVQSAFVKRNHFYHQDQGKIYQHNSRSPPSQECYSPQQEAEIQRSFNN